MNKIQIGKDAPGFDDLDGRLLPGFASSKVVHIATDENSFESLCTRYVPDGIRRTNPTYAKRARWRLCKFCVKRLREQERRDIKASQGVKGGRE